MQGDEIRALRRLQREQGPSSHVFMTERDGPMTPKAFHAGHDTRSLQAYLGHRNIQHTVRYTELAPNRFKDFWR
jgi:hypothetical protein